MDASALMDLMAVAYAGADDEERWLEAVAEAALPLMSRGLGLHAWLVTVRNQERAVLSHPIVLGAEPQWQLRWRADWWEPFMEAARPEDVAFLHQFGGCTYATDLWRASRMNAPTYAEYLGHLAAHGYGRTHSDFLPAGATPRGEEARLYPDSFNLVALDASGTGCALVANLGERAQACLPPHEVTQWERLGTHLAAALRLQRGRSWQLEAELILEGDGGVAHAAGPAQDAEVRERLRADMRAVDALLRRAPPAPDRALETWRPQHQGRWSVFERVDNDGRRYLVAQPNEAPGSAPGRTLTERESQVAAMAAQGKANKLIAYDLGVTVSTVGTTLSRTMLKLGLQSRAELVAWVRARQGPEVEEASPPVLTGAQRDIFGRLQAGETAATIARARAASEHTVRNQISKLYEVLGVQGRSEFLSRYPRRT